MKYVIAFVIGFVVVGAWTKAHAGDLLVPPPMLTPGHWTCELSGRGTFVCTKEKETPCAPGHEAACQRDHGTDGLRRSEQR
jgi:hypothetical protein